MPVSEPALDPEVISAMKSILVEHVDRRLAEHDTKTERRMKELSARPPGAVAGAAAGPRALLAGDTKFLDFLRQGRAGRFTKFSAAFSDFHLEVKAGPLLSPALKTPVPGIAGPAEMSLRLTEFLPTVLLPTGGSVEFVKETTFVPGAAVQIEGEIKAVTDIAFTAATANVKTVATTVKSSLQAIADTPQLSQWLDSRLRFSVQLAAEEFLLNATPDGLLAVATAADPLFAPSTGSTPLDAIAGAIAQLEASGYVPDGVVMGAADVSRMRLLKNSNNDYVWAAPGAAMAAPLVWNLPLVVSPSMAAGSFLVAAFSQAVVVYARQALTVDVAFENEDDFIRNLCTFRAEERFALTVPRPTGLVKGVLPTGGALAAAAARK